MSPALASARARGVLIGSMLFLIAGCRAGGDGSASGGLVGTAWVVTEIAGTATLDGGPPTLTFAEDGTVSGTDGCNQYSATFRTDGDRIEIGAGHGTDRACEGVVMAQATAFLESLGGATTWRQSETGMLQLEGHGDLLAEPAPEPAPPTADVTAAELAGTTWVLIDLDGSEELLGAAPTLEIGEDGTVGGSAGCNTYSGPYAAEGMEISIGPLATTKMACEGPAGDIERTYLAALDAAGLWSLDDAGHLVLAGPTPLTFAPG